MSVFKHELRKIMLCQKGLAAMLLVVIFHVCCLAVSDNPGNYAMEQYRSEYEWYLNQVQGQCCDESARYLEQEAERIAQAAEQGKSLLQDYYDGKLGKSDYEKASREMEDSLSHQNGFEVIYQQYLFICENRDNRYFVQTNGWSGLLGGGMLDFPLIVGILFFITPVFCLEYGCQMDALILVSKDGRKSAGYKIIIALMGAALLCLSLSFTEYAFYSIRYGLTHGDFPMQSLSYFAQSTKQLSLFQAYVWITVMKCFGGVFFAVFLLFLSAVVKKYALTLLTGSAVILLPYIGLPKTVIYRLPLPLPFLLGTDYFVGNVIEYDSLTGDASIVFEEISFSFLCVITAWSVLLCILAILYILRCSSNQWRLWTAASVLTDRKKRLLSAAWLLAPVLTTASGCSSPSNSIRIHTAAYNSSAQPACMGYKVIQDTAAHSIYLEKEETGEKIEVPRSPLAGAFSDGEMIQSCFICPPCLYYSKKVTESHINRVGRYKSIITKVAVIELDLESMRETVIFEQLAGSGRSIAGIEYETGGQWEFLQYHNGMFLNDDSIFFIGSNGITQVSRLTKKITKIDIPTNGSISFDGSSIFYLNTQSVLTKYNIAGGETIVYDGVAAQDFCVSGETIYYISRTDSCFVYACDKDGRNCHLIYEKPALSIADYGGKLKVLFRDGITCY